MQDDESRSPQRAESSANPLNVLIVLMNELGTALEMSYDEQERQALWSDALDALGKGADILRDAGLPTPGVVKNILQSSR